MKIFDRNAQHRLALVETEEPDARGFRGRYVSLTPEMEAAPLEPLAFVYLQQRHYVARAHPSGLVIARMDDMLPGWERFDAERPLWDSLRGAA